MEAPDGRDDVTGLAAVGALPLEERVAALTEVAQRLEDELETTDSPGAPAQARPRS